MSNPWEEHPDIWPTKASFFNYVRGGIRKGLWNRHPVKLEFIKKHRFKAPLGKKTKRNPEGIVWACKCALCGETFRQTQCQVDHIEGNHSLKDIKDLRDFVEKMIFVSEEDLQIVDEGCHKIKNYSQKMGISFEEAKIEKQVIAFGKKPVNKQKEILIDLYCGDKCLRNADTRKEAYRNILKQNVN